MFVNELPTAPNADRNVLNKTFYYVLYLIYTWIELRFYVIPDKNWVMLETFFSANLLD